MNWTLIYDEEIPPDPTGMDFTARNLAPPFTWLRIWDLIIGDQKLHRLQYTRPA